MKLLEQILSELGADTLKSITLIPGFGCYLKSVKAVTEFSAEKAVIKVGKLSVTVEGSGISVGEYFQGDLMLKGDIRGVKIDRPL